MPGMYVPPGAYQGAAPVSRSATPRVVGILAIVFASIGVLFALVVHFGPMSDLDRWGVSKQASGLMSWMWGSLALSIGLFALHMIAGVCALIYRPSAPRLITAYALFAILLGVADIVLSMALIPDNLQLADYISRSQVKESMLVRAVFAGIALPWPIVALALMNTRSAKVACGHAP
jgi:Na+/proline symporter